MSYRTGTKVKRNLYEGDRLVGQCQSDSDADRIVSADAEIQRLRKALVAIRAQFEGRTAEAFHQSDSQLINSIAEIVYDAIGQLNT